MAHQRQSKKVNSLWILKEPLKCVIRWTTERLDPGKNCQSRAFFFDGVQCQLTLLAKLNSLDLDTTRGKLAFARKYKCTVHVENNKGHALPLSEFHNSIDLSEEFIWQCEEADSVFLSRGVFSFLVILDAEEQSTQEIEGRNWLEDCSSFRSLSRDLRTLLDGERMAPDMHVRCGDHTLPAHKGILSARSEVFNAMLQTDMLEKRTGCVDIPDLDPAVLKQFLGYIYTGTLSRLTVDTASRLYEASDKYAVISLKEKCADFLSENLAEDNACELLALADSHSDPDLKECVLRYVLDEDIPLRSGEGWHKFSNSHPMLANEVLYRAYKVHAASKEIK